MVRREVRDAVPTCGAILSRGGAGRGQGRKPVLSDWQRIVVGQECETRWQDEIKSRLDTKVAESFELVEEEWARLHRVPVPRRRAWLQSEEAGIVFADIEIARRERLGLSDNDRLPSIASFSVPRPKGLRREIISQVAVDETQARGFSVSERLVEACWKEYRQLIQEIRSDRV